MSGILDHTNTLIQACERSKQPDWKMLMFMEKFSMARYDLTTLTI